MNPPHNDIPLSEAISRIVSRLRLVAACAAAGLAIGTLIAFTARPVFVGEILILPQSEGSQSGGGGGGGISKRLSGLASAAGLALGGGADSDAKDAAVQTLTSYKTLSTFLSVEGIQKRVLDESSRWDPLKLFHVARHQTLWRAVQEFKDHLTIKEVKDTSILKLDLEWYDAESASKWANELVALADSSLRTRAMDTSRGRIDFLEKELEHNPIVSVHEAISGMMESEFQTLATAGADKEFAFRIIDPATPAEKPARPHRLLIISALGLSGLFLGSIIAVLLGPRRLSSDKIPT